MLKKLTLVGFATLALLVASVSAKAQVELQGDLDGAPYRIRVPANWNGTLLVYAHGYRDKADHPGEVDNRNADAAPNAALEAPLLAQGYALAGSAYRDNGWAVEEGVRDTKDLVKFFKSRVGKPEKTILWGFSLGSVITLDSMEQSSGTYDGAIAACAVGAGASRSWDNAGDLALAYDVVFGMPSSWGTPDDINDFIDFESQVFPKLLSEVNNFSNFGKYEFIRLVVGTPGSGLTPPANFYPNWLFTDMFFATEARAELERRAGGHIVQNLDHEYTLTAAEKAYLAGLGINADALLVTLNDRRNISAQPSARNYLKRNADYKGKIKHPVLTLHTIIDPLVVVSQERAYAETVAAAGRSDLLFQTYTTGVGHCAFSGPQLLTVVNAMNNWVRTGTAPTAANFPATLGFAPTFVPPAFPQP